VCTLCAQGEMTFLFLHGIWKLLCFLQTTVPSGVALRFLLYFSQGVKPDGETEVGGMGRSVWGGEIEFEDWNCQGLNLGSYFTLLTRTG